MSGDISKMFREISLDKSEYDFHHFIHRDIKLTHIVMLTNCMERGKVLIKK